MGVSKLRIDLLNLTDQAIRLTIRNQVRIWSWGRCALLQPLRIDRAQRVAVNVCVGVDPSIEPDRIGLGVSPPRPGRLVVTQGGFLRCASSAAGFVRCSLSAPQPHAFALARTRRLDRACTRSAPASAAATRLGAGAPSRQARRLPVLPAVLTAAAPTPIPPRFSEGSESPSAVTRACHVVWQSPAERRASGVAPPRQGRVLRVA